MNDFMAFWPLLPRDIRLQQTRAILMVDFCSIIIFYLLSSDVTYSAGCSVLRMLEAIVAPDFYSIIKKYLTRFAFGNTDMADLIALITEVS
jgi:hypothetical protein